jgi:predicted DNA-binding ribbon-helix-helix protein
MGAMSAVGESAWTGARTLAANSNESSSRERLIEARGQLLRMEREHINHSQEAENAALREVESLEHRIFEIKSQAWAIDHEAEMRVAVIRRHARLENELAHRIREIADRSALSILDRIKEASDSLMNFASLIGEDMSEMMKKEASEQVARKIADIEATEEAMADESRAGELLELASQYRKGSAA